MQEPAPLLGRPSSIVLDVKRHGGTVEVSLWRAATRGDDGSPGQPARWFRVSRWEMDLRHSWAGVLEDISAGAIAALAADVWSQQVLDLQVGPEDSLPS